MSHYLTVLLIACWIASLAACNESKLRDEVMDDSTWETSTGDETWDDPTRPSERDDQWEQTHEPMEGAPSTGDQKPESRLEQSYPRVSTGVISRHELVPVLDEGLGRFLQNVETEPDFHKGAFVGFRIVSLFPGDPTFASLDLRPGDTVTRINGKPIERPEQAAAVWENLRTASDLVVDYQRNGEKHALQFTIVDAT
ncbi:MAG: hypothetical protein WCE62_06470 [Polyangiales bacterium]